MATKTSTVSGGHAKRPPQARSIVSNGQRLFPRTVDCRSGTGRRFRDLVDDIAGDLGGWEYLSTLQQQLVRRAAIMSALCEREEAKAINDDPDFNIEFLSVAVDRLGRIADRLGLYRVAKNVPTLDQYLKAKDEQGSPSETCDSPLIADEDEIVSVKRSGHT